MYPLTRVDGDGQTLDGSKNNYTLTFPPGQQPPVNAFWSLTMYDGKTQLLIENPINRYLINSPMLPSMKNERGRLADALHPEQIARRRQGSQLAAGSERPDLSRDAALLAEDRSAVDPACGRRHLEAARHQARLVEHCELASHRFTKRRSRFAAPVQSKQLEICDDRHFFCEATLPQAGVDRLAGASLLLPLRQQGAMA